MGFCEGHGGGRSPRGAQVTESAPVTKVRTGTTKWESETRKAQIRRGLGAGKIEGVTEAWALALPRKTWMALAAGANFTAEPERRSEQVLR